MKIAFFAAGPKSGLDNNGGSRTIVRSARALRELGHDVCIVATYDKYTWDEHPPCEISIPKDTDAVVAASARDVKDMHRLAPEPARKFWWIRGWELWQMPEEKLWSRVRMGQKNICISSWLVDHLNGNGEDATLCYAGLDIDTFNRIVHPLRLDTDKFRIGCLWGKKPTKNYSHFKQLWVRLSNDPCFSFTALSATDVPYGDSFFCDEVVVNPSEWDKTFYYSSLQVWFAPTELEGFHQCPAEAALAGAIIAHSGNPRNGMGDYCNCENSIIYKDIGDAAELIYEISTRPVFCEDTRKAMGAALVAIGDREKNMRKFVEILNG